MKKDYTRKCIFCGKTPIRVKKGRKIKAGAYNIIRCMTCGKLQQRK